MKKNRIGTQALQSNIPISIIDNEEQKRMSILNASNFLAEIIKEEMVKEAKEYKEAA